MWTDESTFELLGSKPRVSVRRTPSERMEENCIVPTVKHGGESGGCVVIVSGYFGGVIAGDFVQIKCIIRKEEYHSTLKRHAIPSGCCIIGHNFVLQQDNDAPKHNSKACTNYLKPKEDRGIL